MPCCPCNANKYPPPEWVTIEDRPVYRTELTRSRPPARLSPNDTGDDE